MDARKCPGFVPGCGGEVRRRKSRLVCVRPTMNTALAEVERVRNMQAFKREEKLLFVPNAGSRAGTGEDDMQVLYAYPNEYSVGICSLGYQVVWAIMSRIEGVSVSRLFSDASDPLPRNIDLLGFSVSWELDFPGIFDTLGFLGVPRRSEARTKDDPIVFGGGPVLTANAEPFADFFDVILVGDGEELLGEFINTWRDIRGQFDSRLEALAELAHRVEGVYVPALYNVTYESATGPIAAIGTRFPKAPLKVKKRTYRGPALAASTVISPKSAWENIHMVEVVRSCPEMCRFCLASYSTLPFRAASIDDGLLPVITSGLQYTNRLGILGASVTQHPQFDQLVDLLSTDKYKDVRISLSSVRTNTVTEKLAKLLVEHDSRSITVAVESGSERLRNVINKKLKNEEIFEAALRARSGGLSGIKLYGMVGLPGERKEDLEQTVQMFKDLRKALKGSKAFRVTFGCSTFVPKAHTPFQWFPVRKDADKSLKMLEKEMRKIGVEFRPESFKWSTIQALISRGDRRVALVLEKAAEYGGSVGSIKRAMKDLKGRLPPLDYYVYEEWPIDRVLPWSTVQMSLSNELIIGHREHATKQM